MNPNSLPCPQPLHSQTVWLRVTLSSRFTAAQVARRHQRLQTSLSARGLTAARSPERIAIVRHGVAIGPFDQGMVMGWLLAQPEVVFVHVERRPFAGLSAAATRELSHV